MSALDILLKKQISDLSPLEYSIFRVFDEGGVSLAEQAAEELAQMEAIRAYATHKDNCMRNHGTLPCTCGYDILKAGKP